MVAEGPDGRTTFEADLVVACDGMRSPTRAMAGLEAKFDALPEAELGFMSPTVADVSFAMAYLSDGGHIGVLSWPEGSAGWRSVDRVGREAVLAPGLDAIKEMWARLLPEAASAIEGVTSLDQVRYTEVELLALPRVVDARRRHHRRLGPLLRAGDRRVARASAWATPTRSRRRSSRTRTTRTPPASATRPGGRPAVRPYEANDPGRQRILVAGTVQARPEERWPPPE